MAGAAAAAAGAAVAVEGAEAAEAGALPPTTWSLEPQAPENHLSALD